MSNGNGSSDHSGFVDKDHIIDNIELARTQNNMSWMHILRIAMKHAPIETSEVLRRINQTDDIISAFTKELAK